MSYSQDLIGLIRESRIFGHFCVETTKVTRNLSENKTSQTPQTELQTVLDETGSTLDLSKIIPYVEKKLK